MCCSPISSPLIDWPNRTWNGLRFASSSKKREPEIIWHFTERTPEQQNRIPAQEGNDGAADHPARVLQASGVLVSPMRFSATVFGKEKAKDMLVKIT
jgi:hypothetical protein